MLSIHVRFAHRSSVLDSAIKTLTVQKLSTETLGLANKATPAKEMVHERGADAAPPPRLAASSLRLRAVPVPPAILRNASARHLILLCADVIVTDPKRVALGLVVDALAKRAAHKDGRGGA